MTIKHSRQAKKIVTNQDQVTITDNPIILSCFGLVLCLSLEVISCLALIPAGFIG
ncbi:hypothetical protein [Streptococcus equi]|uniref:hypothetical protein n=1 Tax=Streptococcus equi TaxID=1336 RepID=UPI001E6029B2|nr:hypothetical protein [Streptococcus equi]